MPRKKSGAAAKNQLTFSFEVSVDDVFTLEGGSPAGLSDFDFHLRNTLKELLDDAARRPVNPLDREEIAARMTDKLGRRITKTHLDEWTAKATINRRIHVDALRGLCEVTGDMRPIHYFVESCGLRALTPDLARCAEWGASEVIRRNLANKQKSLGIELENPTVINALTNRLLNGGNHD
ncbi:MAG: hypothetical protein SFW64_00080 [Alphaproteobacteria bacterium]|nr:hypothetical protein [Alphaproteobacteria bacterium]